MRYHGCKSFAAINHPSPPSDRSAVAALNDLPQKQFREALLRAIAGLVDSEGRSTSFLEDLVAAQSRTNAEVCLAWHKHSRRQQLAPSWRTGLDKSCIICTTCHLQASEVEAACVALGLSKPVAADIATAVSARYV